MKIGSSLSRIRKGSGSASSSARRWGGTRSASLWKMPSSAVGNTSINALMIAQRVG
jgi:hypothetical protein